MRKVKCKLSIGLSNAYQDDEWEIPDDYDESDIEQEVQDWANNYIDLGWEVVE